MSLFGSPKKSYVFIFYRSTAPSKDEQDKIVSSFAKGKTQIAFGEAKKLEDEHWLEPVPVREAYLNALSTMYLARVGKGSSGKLAYKTHQMNGYLITTVSGDID